MNYLCLINPLLIKIHEMGVTASHSLRDCNSEHY